MSPAKPFDIPERQKTSPSLDAFASAGLPAVNPVEAERMLNAPPPGEEKEAEPIVAKRTIKRAEKGGPKQPPGTVRISAYIPKELRRELKQCLANLPDDDSANFTDVIVEGIRIVLTRLKKRVQT
jgi:hypothetical protein